jgi:hypothetical protein
MFQINGLEEGLGLGKPSFIQILNNKKLIPKLC